MLGALFTSSAISSLAGPPMVGFLMDYTGSAIWPPIFAAVSGVLAFVVLMPLGKSEASANSTSTIEIESRERGSACEAKRRYR
jgi:hypothetical protein